MKMKKVISKCFISLSFSNIVNCFAFQWISNQLIYTWREEKLEKSRWSEVEEWEEVLREEVTAEVEESGEVWEEVLGEEVTAEVEEAEEDWKLWSRSEGLGGSGPEMKGNLFPVCTSWLRLNDFSTNQDNGQGGEVPNSSTMVAIRHIPAELNNITRLNSHFSKFGVLLNVQIHFEGDPCSALITFIDADEAAAAVNSTEVIMNDPFIKVFSHVKKTMTVKERLGLAGKNTPSKEELDAEMDDYFQQAKK